MFGVDAYPPQQISASHAVRHADDVQAFAVADFHVSDFPGSWIFDNFIHKIYSKSNTIN